MATPKASSSATKTSGFDFMAELKNSFDTIKAVSAKPASKGADKLSNYKDITSAGFLAIFVVVIYAIINLLTTMVGAIVVKTISFTRGVETKVDWGNLNNVDYLKTIGQGLLYGAIGLLIITAVIYLVALVMKKTTNFAKILSIIASGIIPMVVAGLIGTIVSTVSSEIGTFISAAGLFYSGAIMISSVNKETAFEGDKKIYFHTISLLVILIVTYLILVNILKSSLLSAYSLGL